MFFIFWTKLFSRNKYQLNVELDVSKWEWKEMSVQLHPRKYDAILNEEMEIEEVFKNFFSGIFLLKFFLNFLIWNWKRFSKLHLMCYFTRLKNPLGIFHSKLISTFSTTRTYPFSKGKDWNCKDCILTEIIKRSEPIENCNIQWAGGACVLKH